MPGFAEAPSRRPCEHRREWMRGRLCLACDNTNWRPCAKGEEGLDPYAAEVRSGVTVARDESTSARRARDAERIDAEIAQLQRNVRLREGTEAPEGPAERNLRLIGTKTSTLKRILLAVAWMRERLPDVHVRSETGLMVLAKVVPGRIDRPPFGVWESLGVRE